MTEQERYTKGQQYSYFNEAGLKINRINYLWEQALQAKLNGKLKQYDNCISSVLDEIVPDAKLILSDAEYKKHMKNIKEINEAITKYRKDRKRNLIYHWLKVKERRARLIQNEIGSGAKIVQKEDKGHAIFR